MTANMARQESRKSREFSLEEVHKIILEYSKQGRYQCRIEKNNKTLTPLIIKELERLF
jgi:hypothetical protein